LSIAAGGVVHGSSKGQDDLDGHGDAASALKVRIVQVVPAESGGFLRLSIVFDNPSTVTQTITGISLILTIPRWNPWMSPLGHDSYRMSPVVLLRKQGADGFMFSGDVAHVGGPASGGSDNVISGEPAPSSSGSSVELLGSIDLSAGGAPTLRLEFNPTTVLESGGVTDLALELPSRMLLKRDVGMLGSPATVESGQLGTSLLPYASQITRIEAMARVGGNDSVQPRLCASKAIPPSDGMWGTTAGLWDIC
jgi:hypothetical protein